MSTLQDLWYGNISPNENKVITDKEKKLIELIARYHETLSSSLKKNDLDVFEKCADCFTFYIIAGYQSVRHSAEHVKSGKAAPFFALKIL